MARPPRLKIPPGMEPPLREEGGPLSLSLASLLPVTPLKLLLLPNGHPIKQEIFAKPMFDAVQAKELGLQRARGPVVVQTAHAAGRVLVSGNPVFYDFDNLPLTISRVSLPEGNGIITKGEVEKLRAAAFAHFTAIPPAQLTLRPYAVHYDANGMVHIHEAMHGDPYHIEEVASASYANAATNRNNNLAHLFGMPLFLDQNVKAPSRNFLAANRCDLLHTEEVGLRETDDGRVLAEAYKRRRVLVSHDGRAFAHTNLFPLTPHRGRVVLPAVGKDRYTLTPVLKAALTHLTREMPVQLLNRPFVVVYGNDGLVTVSRPDSETPYIMHPLARAAYMPLRGQRGGPA